MPTHLLIADGHFSLKLCPTEVEAIRRIAVGLIGKEKPLAKKIVQHYEHQRLSHMWAALRQAEIAGPYQGLVSLGDNLHDWDNLGLDCEIKVQEAMLFKQRLLEIFCLHGQKQVWVPGNHDLGYLNCSWSMLGPTLPPPDNFANFQNIFGPVYGQENLSDYFTMIWLSTVHAEVLIAKPGSLSDEQLDSLVKRQQEELAFLETTLEKLDGKFLLGIHDPGSFLSPQLTAILNRHLDKLAGSFTGHLHAEWLLKLAKLYRPSFRAAFNRYKVQFIPSIWGVVLPLFL